MEESEQRRLATEVSVEFVKRFGGHATTMDAIEAILNETPPLESLSDFAKESIVSLIDYKHRLEEETSNEV